ncbi:MAG: hypothetical protein ACI396_06105 [Acutalibacteraceae bacterium]
MKMRTAIALSALFVEVLIYALSIAAVPIVIKLQRYYTLVTI